MVTGIILASGYSRRMGENKLLMDVKGKKMIEWVIINSKNSLLDQIILVYRCEEVKKIGDSYGIKTIHNPKSNLGQSEGLKVGVKKACNSDAYMFLLGDQPFVNNKLIDKLIIEYNKNKNSIIVPYYEGMNGTPTIFPSSYRKELLEVEGDQGGKDIIKNKQSSVKKIYINNAKLGFDIDKPSDFKIVKDIETPYDSDL